MRANNPALELQVVDASTNWETVMIGPSHFTDDIWDMRQFMPAKTTSECNKYLKFYYIKNPNMKHIAKQYAYYKLGRVKPKSVQLYINGFLRPFFEFCEMNGIHRLSEMTREQFFEYNRWLKEDKKIAIISGSHSVHAVEEIIRIGQIKGWDVPNTNILRGFSMTLLWDANPSKSRYKTKPIPPDVFDQILYHAVHNEKDILTKASIIIQSQTGLRIHEVLSIQQGCIKTTSDGYDYMEVRVGKTEKGEPVIHKVFINELVKMAVSELSDFTANLRCESGLKELFLIRRKKIHVSSMEAWNSSRLAPFIKRWNIRDSKGDLYHLTSHQFRATYVRELVKKKVPIALIMKQYAHVSLEMTAHYLTLQEEEVKEIYSDIILSPDSKIAGLRAKEIKDKLANLFHGKTREEIDDVISDLTQTMSFNPLPTGVCLYDFRRGNCTDGDGCFMYNCPNYITEVQFLPILKKELDLLETEMNRLKELGHERQWQVEYVKYKYLKPLVEELGAQLEEEDD